MDFLVSMTIEALKFLANFVGNWGIAIIILTIIIRGLMWPSSVSQQRSMRTMQTLQPKMKEIQERYKSNPEQMQKKMTEFYKEHKFNPLSGCLPLLLQLPVFILLYSVLMSPQFTEQAGQTNFLFIKRLDATIKSNSGISYDGSFTANQFSKFASGKTAVVYLDNDEVLEGVKVEQPLKAVVIQGDIMPSQPIDLKVYLDNLNLKFTQLDKIKKADFDIINTQTKETEKVTFMRDGNLLTASVPTVDVKETIHYDVIFLVFIFVATMWFSQKVMTASSKNIQQDPTQAAMQKSMSTVMPIMIGATFIFIPIPAGVLLYLVTSNVFQIVQTIIINKQMDLEELEKRCGPATGAGKVEVTNAANGKIKGAKKIEAKDVKDVENADDKQSAEDKSE